jgi:hypothetical protein
MADGLLPIAGSADDRALRQEVKSALDGARTRIRSYTGLYTGENLTGDVLAICNTVAASVAPNARLREAIAAVDGRCGQLAAAADRFAERDLAAIAASRALAVAAIDMFQDVIVDLRKSALQTRGAGSLLKRRAR